MKRVAVVSLFLLLTAFAFAPVVGCSERGQDRKAAQAKTAPKQGKGAGKTEWLVFSAKEHQNERKLARRAEHMPTRQDKGDKLYVAVADLNNDGTNEVFVWFETFGRCGAAGCTFNIYRRNGKGLESILEGDLFNIDLEFDEQGHQKRVGILPGTTKGWRDITLSGGSVVKWNGKSY